MTYPNIHLNIHDAHEMSGAIELVARVGALAVEAIVSFIPNAPFVESKLTSQQRGDRMIAQSLAMSGVLAATRSLQR